MFRCVCVCVCVCVCGVLSPSAWRDAGDVVVQVLFKVFSGHKPDVPGDMPAEYRGLLEECWAKDATKRPSFKCVLSRLQALLIDALPAL